MTQKLGEGIARVIEEYKPPGVVRLAYRLGSEDARRTLEVLGYSLGSIIEDNNDLPIAPNTLALFNNEVWYRTEAGELKCVLNLEEQKKVQELITEKPGGHGLYETEDTNTGKHIFVRTVNDDSREKHQIWIAKDPGNTQVLLDALFCLQFKQPALDEYGNNMTPDKIEQKANSVGIMIDMSSDGTLLIPVTINYE